MLVVFLFSDAIQEVRVRVQEVNGIMIFEIKINHHSDGFMYNLSGNYPENTCKCGEGNLKVPLRNQVSY